MKFKLLKIFVWIPAILMAFVMFGFSGQNGETSGGMSERVAEVLVDCADNMRIINVDSSNRDIYIENLQFPIRKAAHITEYAILTILIAIALYVDGVKLKMLKYYCFAITFAYACLDEIHQLFVPERSGKFTDVLIDSIGMTIALILFYVAKRKKQKAVD